MNYKAFNNQNEDNIFDDIQIDIEEKLEDKNNSDSNFAIVEQSSLTDTLATPKYPVYSLLKPFCWRDFTEKRLNCVRKRQKINDSNKKNKYQEETKNHQVSNLERIKTNIIAIVITLGMLPLLISSGVAYYLGNEAIEKQEIYNKQQNSQLLQESFESQKRNLLFLLAGTEIAALILGIVGALWGQKTINQIANVASKTTSVGIELENRQQSQILAKIILNIRQSINSEDIMANAVMETRKVLQCDRVIIYQFEPQGTGNVLAESLDPQFSEILLTYTEDLGLESKYLSQYQKKCCQVINNIYQESQLAPEHLSQYESLDVKSCLHAPLEQQSEVVGLLIAYQCSDFRSWESSEIELFNQIAIEIGLALDDAQLVTDCLNLQGQLQETSLWQKYLSDSLEYIHSSNVEEEIIKIAVEEFRRVLKCDRVVFYHLDSSKVATIVAESVSPEYPKILGTVIEEHSWEMEYSQDYKNTPLHVIHDVEEAHMSPSDLEQLENLGVKSLIFSSIIHRNQLYGFLIAHQCSVQRFWQEIESKWFKQCAKQVGYSLDNAKSIFKTKESLQECNNIAIPQAEKKALILSQLPIFLEESKISLENFSQKFIGEVNKITTIFKQMQLLEQSIEELTNKLDQTKLHSQQVDGILRVEQENIDLTEDRLIDIQQNLGKIAVKNINLGQSCQQFIQAAEQINNLGSEINQQIEQANFEANRIGFVSINSLEELTRIVSVSTKQLMTKTEELQLCLRKIKAETEEITNGLENSEAKAFVGIEIVQETRQNLNQIITRNQEINKLIQRINLAATRGKQNPQLGQQSLLEVVNLAQGAAQKSLAAVDTIASLTEFLEKL